MEQRPRAYIPAVNEDAGLIDDSSSLGFRDGAGLSEGASSAILEAARWGRYYLYLIVGYLALSIGLQLLGVGVGSAAAGGAEAFAAAGVGIAGLVFFYVFALGLYLYPLVKFWSFTTKTAEGITRGEHVTFARGLSDLRQVYKYIGVILFILLGIYALMFLVVIVAGGIGALAG